MEITQQDRNEALECWEDGDAIKEVVLKAVSGRIAGLRLLLRTLDEFLVSEHAPECWCDTLYHRRDGIDSSCERCKIEKLLYEIKESRESECSEPVAVLQDSAARHESMSGNKPLIFGLPLSQGEIEAVDEMYAKLDFALVEAKGSTVKRQVELQWC